MVGWRQRAQGSHAGGGSPARSRTPAPLSSTPLPPLLRRWLFEYAWGDKSAVSVSADAGAYVEGTERRRVDPRILRLAQTRSHGQRSRQVIDSILPMDGVLQTLRVPDSAVEHVLLPRTSFDWLQDNHPRRFEVHFGAKEGGVSDWWASLASSTQGQELWQMHPWLRGRTPEDLQYHVPVCVFDDAGPVSNSQSAYVRQWFSILGQGSDRETHLLLATGLAGTELEDKSWGPILESFAGLAGPQLQGRFGAILLFFCGDLDYVCNVMGLPHFNSELSPCSLCLANHSSRQHNDWSSTAAWRGTILNNRSFLVRLRRPLHPLVAHDLFNIHTFRHDLLHMSDHHGVISHVVANVLWAHIGGDREAAVIPGSNMEQRLAFLNEDVRAFYNANHVHNRLPPFREENIKDGPWPELKGRNVKAANTRAFVPYVVALQERATTMADTPKNRHMLRVVRAVAGIVSVVYDGGCFLKPSELAVLSGHIARLARHYQKLSTDAFTAGRTLWKQTMKFHFMVAHLLGQASLINPTWVQGYSGESMVGTTAQIYSMCQNGPFHAHVQEVVMTKYRLGLRLLMEG